MKSIFPLAAASLLLIASCDKHEESAAASQPGIANLTAATMPSSGVFENVTDIWRLIHSDQMPAGERFSPDQRKNANQIFAQYAISKPARFTFPNVTVDRVKDGVFKGALRMKATYPNVNAKINLYAYFDTADEKSSQTILELRPKATVLVEGIITRCDITKGANGPILNIDLRQSKMISAESNPATQPN